MKNISGTSKIITRILRESIFMLESGTDRQQYLTELFVLHSHFPELTMSHFKEISVISHFSHKNQQVSKNNFISHSGLNLFTTSSYP